jgi:hypothetical protein
MLPFAGEQIARQMTMSDDPDAPMEALLGDDATP